MKSNLLYAMLAVIGLTMITVGGYIQWVSMGRGRFDIVEGLLNDAKQLSWWVVVGVPVLIGFMYVVAACRGLLKSKQRGGGLRTFVTAFAVALLALPCGGLAIYGAIATGILLAVAWYWYKRSTPTLVSPN